MDLPSSSPSPTPRSASTFQIFSLIVASFDHHEKGTPAPAPEEVPSGLRAMDAEMTMAEQGWRSWLCLCIPRLLAEMNECSGRVPSPPNLRGGKNLKCQLSHVSQTLGCVPQEGNF